MKLSAKQCSLHNDKASMLYSVILAVRPGQATACWPPGGLAGMVYNMRGKLFTTYPWNSPARQSELDGGSRCWLIHQILEAVFEDNANSTSVQFAKGKVTVQLSWLKLDAKIMFITLLLLVYFQSPNPLHLIKQVCTCIKRIDQLDDFLHILRTMPTWLWSYSQKEK